VGVGARALEVLVSPALLALLVGCGGASPGGAVVAAGSGGDTSAGTDTPDPTDTGTTGSTEPAEAVEPCEALGARRGRCAVADRGNFAAGSADAVLGGDTLTLDLAAAHAGTDSDGTMNGGSFEWGTWTSAELAPGVAFDGLVPSWNVVTPAGTWVKLEAQARVGGEWSGWFDFGVWASGRTDVDRASAASSSNRFGEVWTDTLFLDQPADAARLRLTLYSTGSASPTVSRVAFAVADTGADARRAPGGEAWGIALDVPDRSQMVFEDGGEVWCSPTSTSMVMAYHAQEAGREEWDRPVPEVVDGVWDDAYDGGGNWPFNVAYAASLGLAGEVGWFDSLAALEPWIAAGVPVVLSAAWDAGDIDGAAISSTNGHLLVLRGFDADGDALVNDPAGRDDTHVSLTYRRDQLEDAWLGGSGGVVYLIWNGPRPQTAK